MPLAIHFGVHEDEFPTLFAQFNRIVPESPFGPISLNDNWHQWGSQEKTRADQDYAVHVVIETDTPMVLLNFTVEHFRNFFVPLDGEGYDGVTILVTDAVWDVWHGRPIHEYLEFRYP